MTVPGAVSVIVASPASTTTRNISQSPNPGGTRMRRVPLICQAISLASIGTARIIHMKSARPSAHQIG